MTSTIINPFQEKLLKEAQDGLVADEKNLARTLFTNSFFGKTHPNEGLSAVESFDLAHSFLKEQTRRFPKNDTVDGRSKE